LQAYGDESDGVGFTVSQLQNKKNTGENEDRLLSKHYNPLCPDDTPTVRVIFTDALYPQAGKGKVKELSEIIPDSVNGPSKTRNASLLPIIGRSRSQKTNNSTQEKLFKESPIVL
jgi:hypothetical protein